MASLRLIFHMCSSLRPFFAYVPGRPDSIQISAHAMSFSSTSRPLAVRVLSVME